MRPAAVAFGATCALFGCTGPRAVSLFAGALRPCAILDDGTVSCRGEWRYTAGGEATDGGSWLQYGWHPGGALRGLAGARFLVVAQGRLPRSLDLGFLPGTEENTYCGVSGAARVVCWGNAPSAFGSGSCPAGSRSGAGCDPAEVPLSGSFRAVAVGEWQVCAISVEGAVWCWGGRDLFDEHGGVASPRRIRELEGAEEIALGAHGCARFGNGSVRCWGPNTEGQLGDGRTSQWSLPVAVAGIGDALQLALNGSSTCAVTAQRTVWCWGANLRSPATRSHSGCEASPGEVVPRCDLVPRQVPGLDGVEEVRLGRYFACARTRDSSVYCWGATPWPWLSREEVLVTPTKVPVVGAVQLVCGRSYCCARLSDGGMTCWGSHAGYGPSRAPHEVDWSQPDRYGP